MCMKCPNCGREFLQGKYCPDCGTLVHSGPVNQGHSYSSSKDEEIKKCSDCGSSLKENDKFCPNCGANVNLNKGDSGASKKIKINWDNISNPEGSRNRSKSKTGSTSFKSTESGSSKSTTLKKFLTIVVVCCIGLMIVSLIGSFLSPDSNTSTYDNGNYNSSDNDKFKFTHENRYGSDSSSSGSSSSSSSSSHSSSDNSYLNDIKTDESTDEYKDAYWDGYYGYAGVGAEDDDYYWDAYYDGYYDARS